MQPSTTTSIRNVICTAARNSQPNALLPWQSGVNLRPEVADYGGFEPANLLSDSAQVNIPKLYLLGAYGLLTDCLQITYEICKEIELITRGARPWATG